jgi:hypothetical protein
MAKLLVRVEHETDAVREQVADVAREVPNDSAFRFHKLAEV